MASTTTWARCKGQGDVARVIMQVRSVGWSFGIPWSLLIKNRNRVSTELGDGDLLSRLLGVVRVVNRGFD